ncbi:nuclease-related domain-containing protein [Streptomyces sp. Da 82-17]|uniref:nuclease-related domain-containing protein n=1 Tax=Streptomyces sp. Da 82-17 TaxID=3377116 RepID=UPI0038D4EC6D
MFSTPARPAAGRSAAVEAARIRRAARRGPVRRILSWLGVTAHTRRADAHAARWDIGAAGEQATAVLLRPLQAAGWHVLPDRALPGSKANLDDVLVSPDGQMVVVLETKRWHAQRHTRAVRGRLHCGDEDRHAQAEKVARYCAAVARALGLPAERVQPLMVVHGSPVAGGAVTVNAGGRPVHVLAPGWLVSTLSAAVRVRDPQAAAQLAAQVAQVLPSYGQRC